MLHCLIAIKSTRASIDYSKLDICLPDHLNSSRLYLTRIPAYPIICLWWHVTLIQSPNANSCLRIYA